MNKPSIVLLTLAALGIGSLIGFSLVEEKSAVPVAAAPASSTPTPSTGGAPVFRYLEPGDIPARQSEFGEPLPSTETENFIARDADWKSETLTIELPMDGKIEYKLLMEQGDSVVFNWKAADGQAYYDFHAHDDAFGEEFFTRYDEGEATGRAGMIVAPYKGEHGWFWLNLKEAPLTITLEVAGFYDKIIRVEVADY